MLPLEDKNRIVIGAKQTLKMLENNLLEFVLIAHDADAYVTREIEEISRQKGIAIHHIASMKKLGNECGIRVGAATAGYLKKD